jgi:hypothetical protein
MDACTREWLSGQIPVPGIGIGAQGLHVPRTTLPALCESLRAVISHTRRITWDRRTSNHAAPSLLQLPLPAGTSRAQPFTLPGRPSKDTVHAAVADTLPPDASPALFCDDDATERPSTAGGCRVSQPSRRRTREHPPAPAPQFKLPAPSADELAGQCREEGQKREQRARARRRSIGKHKITWNSSDNLTCKLETFCSQGSRSKPATLGGKTDSDK